MLALSTGIAYCMALKHLFATEHVQEMRTIFAVTKQGQAYKG